jgi:thioredoxin reductase
MDSKERYDVIIIGGSYAGLAAGMALGRALRKVLIVDSGNPCNKQTPHSHNFLTNDGKTPLEIATIAREQMKTYTSVSILDDTVTNARETSTGFEVVLESGLSFGARKLVLATGVRDIMPAIPGFAESWGISALHCPYCHGYEVRNERTGVIGNGDIGYEIASLISNWTKELMLFTNGPSSLTGEQFSRLQKHKINVVEKKVSGVTQDGGYIQEILLEDGQKVPVKAVYIRLPFIESSGLPAVLGCEMTADGYIKIDAMHRTTRRGIFACGDNVSRMRTVANAVAMGTMTGFVVNRELIDEEF